MPARGSCALSGARRFSAARRPAGLLAVRSLVVPRRSPFGSAAVSRWLSSQNTKASEAMVAAQEVPTLDPTTYANYTEIASEHISLSWSLDWERKTVSGSATHTLRAQVDRISEVVCVEYAHDIHACVSTRSDSTRARWSSPRSRSMVRRRRCACPARRWTPPHRLPVCSWQRAPRHGCVAHDPAPEAGEQGTDCRRQGVYPYSNRNVGLNRSNAHRLRTRQLQLLLRYSGSTKSACSLNGDVYPLIHNIQPNCRQEAPFPLFPMSGTSLFNLYQTGVSEQAPADLCSHAVAVPGHAVSQDDIRSGSDLESSRAPIRHPCLSTLGRSYQPRGRNDHLQVQAAHSHPFVLDRNRGGRRGIPPVPCSERQVMDFRRLG